MHVALSSGTASRVRRGILLSAAIAAASALIVAPAQAQPVLPGIDTGSANSGQILPAPEPPATFAPPSINIADGETVGVAQPIIINFKDPIDDRGAAERAIKVTASTETPGHFYWRSDKQVRWRPNDYWPANIDVTVKAGETVSSFRIGDSFIATADGANHTLTVTRNGEVIREMPTSLGKPKYDTPNGIYYVGEQRRSMTMDSSTYGVPVDAPEGYKLEVEYATRISYSGIFVHAAPWSVGQQGRANVSHGCLNLSTEDAKWFFENAKKGDPVVVQNTNAGTLANSDGLGDWNP
ncbi:L,D-transpeptidase [Nocardia sp. NPDC057353]|uniref:L,D-transpeptidase n=1 Tax=Nocardia sp. NPDC057353 TaxID=3346104 RepID=UPI0036273116